MATQKAVSEFVKGWLEADTYAEAVEAAAKAAAEFDGLYTESAKNLVGRSPELLMLLAAFQAGRARGEQEEKERHKPKQEVLK